MTDIYEDCTPTLSYSKARLAKFTDCPCGHGTIKSSCLYCCESKAQLVNSYKFTDSLFNMQPMGNKEVSKFIDI